MYKEDFPFFEYHPDVTYLDSAATSQHPKAVIEAMNEYYFKFNTNIHRSNYSLAYEATNRYEEVRQKTASFINANNSREILFTKGTTQSLNWIATGFAQKILKPGDEIVISVLEHHSNLVVWQKIAKKTGAILKFIGLDDNQALNLQDAENLITSATKIVSISGLSNVLGNKLPLREIGRLAHKVNAVFSVDGAQLVGHDEVDVENLGIDFLAFSAHKMFGPTGIGVLYVRAKFLEQLSPQEFGGEMVDVVTKEKTTFNEIPYRFEAGTQNIAGVFGLGAAIDYIDQVGIEKIATIERDLGQYLYDGLKQIEDIQLYGPERRDSGIVSFNLVGIHPHDVATFLDAKNIFVRAGKHCAEPLLKDLGIDAAVRASMGIYNTKADCDKLIKAIQEIQEFFNG